MVRELDIVEWTDDGEKVLLTVVNNLSKGVPNGLKHELRVRVLSKHGVSRERCGCGGRRRACHWSAA